MAFEDLTLAFFAACNTVRVVGYFPQIWKAATDANGASAVSCTTWALFLVAHLSTVAYATVNRADWGLAACFAGNALCCIVILAVTIAKRRRHARHQERGVASTVPRRATVDLVRLCLPAPCEDLRLPRG